MLRKSENIPEISIIVPVYNVEKYIRRCINSILDQTFKSFELILVDDGSHDDSGLICDEYKRRDNRIQVIHKENGGLSDARNSGIEAIRGRYVTFIDSDDWVSKNYLSVLYELLNEKSAEISICNFLRTSNEFLSYTNSKISVYEYSSNEALTNIFTDFGEQMVVSWGKLYKAELFKEIRFPLGKIHEDEFITYKILYKANRIIFTTEQLLYYWQRPDSIMGIGFKLRNRLHAIEALQERAGFFKSIDRDDLKNKTLKSLFGMYKSINENIHMFEDEDSKEKYLDDYKQFKSKLRISKQPLKFKLYYETYFISPKLADVMEKINKRIKV